jgi:hypothetical protein
MLIALDFSVVGVQRRLGHSSPDTTPRVYAHLWKYREAQRSQAATKSDGSSPEKEAEDLERTASSVGREHYAPRLAELQPPYGQASQMKRSARDAHRAF